MVVHAAGGSSGRHRRLGVPSNLTEELSSFVGRELQVERGVRRLARSRLLTLCGTGGCGKTRLARRIAVGAAPGFPGGVWWVELAAVADRPRIEDAVARAVGLPLPGADGRAAVLASGLADAPALVVLDNCEHLLTEAAAVIDELLRSAPDLRVLATSREPLGVEGELVRRVPMLEVPPTHARPEEVDGFEAVRLFGDRAAAARGGVVLDDATRPTVAALCRALDGLPLALELAAARTAGLTVEAVLAALDDRFRVLTGGPRPAPPRLRSLWASLEWSHDLCSAAEQALLRRLAVFAGGFDLPAATAVAGFAPLERPAVPDVLTELVAKSLVQTDGDLSRYRLLEGVRAFALHHVDEAGERGTVADRHLAWAAGYAESHEDGTARCDVAALDRIEVELPNLRVALAHAAGAPVPRDGARLVAALGHFWARRGHGIAGTDLGEAAVAEDAPVALRARALHAVAYARFYGGDFAVAGTTATRALAAAAEAGDEPLAARCQVLLGALAMFADPAEGRRRCHDALSTARRLEDRGCESDALGLLALSHFVQHRPAAAQPFTEGSARAADAAGDRYGRVWVHLYEGMAGHAAGRLDAAREAYRAGVRAAGEIADPLLTLYGHAGLVGVALTTGRYDDLPDLAAAMNRPEMRFAELTLGFAAALRGIARLREDPASAVGALIAGGAGIAGYVPFEGPRMVLVGARHALALGDVGTAERAATETLAACRAVDSALAGPCLVLLARVRRHHGEPVAAEQLAHEGLAVIVEAELRADLPDALQVIGGLALDGGRPAEGTRLLAAAAALDDASGRRDVLAAVTDGDRERAALADGFDEAWSRGAQLDGPAAVAYARRARGPRGRPRAGWDALSPTELEVVRLAAQGCSNPAIAERLFVTRATVKTHLGHVFAKLGVASRTELAAEAVRRGVG